MPLHKKRGTPPTVDALALLGELPGLEAAKRAIDLRISEIMRQVQKDGRVQYIPPPEKDPTVLGRDSIGRIIRKRNISEEVKEKRRKMIKVARDKKLQAIYDAKGMSGLLNRDGEIPNE
jgi:hypothetical protein